MAAQQDNPFLTITLTGRTPVKIRKEDWPVLVSASDEEHDNQYRFQANRTADWKLTVRQHADGRALVYGVYKYSSNFQGAHDYNIRGGELLVNAQMDLPAAITRVASDLEERIAALPHDSQKWGPGVLPRLAHECIADLPAVEL